MRFAIGLLFALTLCACAKQPTNGKAVLSWNPVKTDLSGKALANVAGYKIYYGTSPNAMGGSVVMLTNPNQTSYVVENLHRGTWYFAVSAYTKGGAESSRTGVVSKTIK